MKKIITLALLLIATPIIVCTLLSQQNQQSGKPVYLHEQKKTTRSSFDMLSSFTNTGKVIIDFYADWCPPCNRMSPLIDELAAGMPQLTFLKINRDYFLDVANSFNITSIPTLIFMHNGKEIGRYDGKPLGTKGLRKLINKIYKNK